MCDARKRFNTTGVCVPSLHYMADTSKMVRRIITDYIEPGEYFTMNRARQFGKTTTLEFLYRELKEDYLVISISFESADEYFQSLGTLARGLAMDISEALDMQGVSDELRKIWKAPVSEEFPMRDFGRKITSLCKNSSKGVVLMIDEVDKNADNQIFLSFLGLLREKYLKQKSGRDVSFHSVILAGVYDIKNLKLKLHTPGETKFNSPWNIAADFQVDMSLSAEAIAGMLREYEQDYHTGMDLAFISRQVFDYTAGYPYLVSRLCQILDEQVAGTREYPDRTSAWTKEGYQEAVKKILYESNTLFDDLWKKLDEYPELSKMLYAVLFIGKNIAYSPDQLEMNIGVRFGIIKCENGQVAVSNRIFESRLYNYYLAKDMVESSTYSAALQSKNQFIHGSHFGG